MKTGEPTISLIRHKTYLSCRASEQEAAISVTDKLEVLVAKIQSGLIISTPVHSQECNGRRTLLYHPRT
jgi:hypothetical protein